MYEFVRGATDLLFYAVAAVAIIGGLMKIRSNKNKAKKDDDAR